MNYVPIIILGQPAKTRARAKCLAQARTPATPLMFEPVLLHRLFMKDLGQDPYGNKVLVEDFYTQRVCSEEGCYPARHIGRLVYTAASGDLTFKGVAPASCSDKNIMDTITQDCIACLQENQ